MSKQQIIKLRKALLGIHVDKIFFLEGEERRVIIIESFSFSGKGKAFKFNFINFQSHSPILIMTFLFEGRRFCLV